MRGRVDAVAVVQRHLDVFDHRQRGQQIVRLKDEADPRGADLGQLVVAHLRDVVVAEHEAAGGGPIEAAEQVEQRALAGAGRAHDRDVVALGHVERHAAQGVDRLAAEHVVLAEIGDADGQPHWAAPLRRGRRGLDVSCGACPGVTRYRRARCHRG